MKNYSAKEGKRKVKAYIENKDYADPEDKSAFSRMMNDAEDGLIDTIIVTKVDRISKEVMKAFDCYKWMEGMGVELLNPFDPFDLSTDGGKIHFMSIALDAEYGGEIYFN